MVEAFLDTRERPAWKGLRQSLAAGVRNNEPTRNRSQSDYQFPPSLTLWELHHSHNLCPHIGPIRTLPVTMGYPWVYGRSRKRHTGSYISYIMSHHDIALQVCIPETELSAPAHSFVCTSGPPWRAFSTTLRSIGGVTRAPAGNWEYLQKFTKLKFSGPKIKDSPETSRYHQIPISKIPPYGMVQLESRYPFQMVHSNGLLQALLDETFKTRSTRDRQGKMPRRLRVVKCQRVEDSSLWYWYLSGLSLWSLFYSRRQILPALW